MGAAGSEAIGLTPSPRPNSIGVTDLRQYVRQVFQAGDNASEDSGRMRNIIEDVPRRANAGIGNDTAAVRRTLWAAYNGVTEFLTHARGKDADARINSLWFGDAANVSRRALEAALALAV